MEQIQIIGNVGKDIAIAGANGSQEAYFSVAVDKSYKKADGTKVEQTNWYTVWKSPSEVDKWIKKGTKVFIQGGLNMKIEDYQGKQTIKLSIKNPTIKLLSAATQQQSTESSTPEPKPQPTINSQLPSATDSDDLPF